MRLLFQIGSQLRGNRIFGRAISQGLAILIKASQGRRQLYYIEQPQGTGNDQLGKYGVKTFGCDLLSKLYL